MIHAAEGQDHGQQQTDRHDHRQIHDRAERDEIEDDAASVLIFGGLAQHPRQLIRYQNRDQNAGHGKPCLYDFA